MSSINFSNPLNTERTRINAAVEIITPINEINEVK
tara:strand:+ start:3982 stop:4086 length:105 start_codon:yes stop_codon:yes gene_type:complete